MFLESSYGTELVQLQVAVRQINTPFLVQHTVVHRAPLGQVDQGPGVDLPCNFDVWHRTCLGAAWQHV